MRLLLASLAAIAVLSGAASAQTPPVTALDTAARRDAVQAAAKAMRSQYVFPDRGVAAADKIERELSGGAYDGLTEPSAFAAQLTADLRSEAPDKHLFVQPPGGPPPGPPANPIPIEGGVIRSDRLPGDVGYIEFVSFTPVKLSKLSVDRAMATLSQSRAIIIDLRRNEGGTVDGAVYIVSHFVDPVRKVHVADLLLRNAGASDYSVEEFWSSPTPTSLAGKPVFVLVGPRTFSAGEFAAYELQALSLARVIGETTLGGAHGAKGLPLGSGIFLSLPGKRLVSEATKTNWEGKGVSPDIAIPAADALAAALRELGQAPASGDIDRLSLAQLFQPRTTPLPGAETALRRMYEAYLHEKVDYSVVSDTFAALVRERGAKFWAQMPAIRKQLEDLGPLQSIAFNGVDPEGSDTFITSHSNGRRLWQVFLDIDGKVDSIFMQVLPPPSGAQP